MTEGWKLNKKNIKVKIPYAKYPDSKGRGANMGPICGRQDPGGPYVGPMNFAIWVAANFFQVQCVDYHFTLQQLINIGSYNGLTLNKQWAIM